MIVSNLYSKLSTPKNKQRMMTTNKLFPQGNLKRKCVSRLFNGWIAKLVGKGRVLTHKLVALVTKRLRKKFQLGSLDDQGEEVRTIHRLIKLARKRQLGSVSCVCRTASGTSAMDTMDTVPMAFEAWPEPTEDHWAPVVHGLWFNYKWNFDSDTLNLWGLLIFQTRPFNCCPGALTLSRRSIGIMRLSIPTTRM